MEEKENNHIDLSNPTLLRNKLYDILKETKGPLASTALRSITLLYQEEKQVNFFEIIKEELGLLADRDSNIAGMIEQFQEGQLFRIEKNKDFYSENIENYEKFIELTSKLVQELALPDNSISASEIVSKLIHDGYLSKNSIFLPIEAETHPNITGFMGMNVINGAGCCRHVSDIHKRIFNNLKLFDIELPGIQSNVISLNNAFHQRANHIVNLINFNDRYYLHDLTAETIGYFKNGFTLNSYQKKLSYRFYYKPTYNMIIENLSQEETINRIIEFHEDSKKPHITRKELNEILKETENRFNQGKSLLSEFQSEKQKYIRKIIPSHLRSE